jgi:hypothetical protein
VILLKRRPALRNKPWGMFMTQRFHHHHHHPHPCRLSLEPMLEIF